LASDSLQDLETFFDTIHSHFSTVTLHNHLYPKYQDLQDDFSFYSYLCSPEHNPTLTADELHQAHLNYQTFGSGLRQFILSPKTISELTSPDSYLQILSLRHEVDGFLLLQQFTCLRSAQLEGKFIDYRAAIQQLTIQPGEPLRSFYSRTIWLFHEIKIAQLKDGSNAALLEHFLDLLRSTGCHVILAETSDKWKTIRAHRHRPKHTTEPLPWTLNSVLRDLENAKVTTLSNNHPLALSPSANLIGCTSHATYLPDPEAHLSRSRPSSNNNKSMIKHPPQATLPSASNKCRLCNNQHPNPWHTTDYCPFKDPTFIQNKLIRENVMQHNSLYGRVNKHYSKDTDITSITHRPSLITPPKTAKLAELQLPTLEASTNDIDLLDATYHPIPPDTDTYPFETPTIDTQHFDVPSPTANNGLATYTPTSSEDDHATSDLIFDPLQYLQYSS
jgi:hypothetical protein